MSMSSESSTRFAAPSCSVELLDPIRTLELFRGCSPNLYAQYPIRTAYHQQTERACVLEIPPAPTFFSLSTNRTAFDDRPYGLEAHFRLSSKIDRIRLA